MLTREQATAKAREIVEHPDRYQQTPAERTLIIADALLAADREGALAMTASLDAAQQRVRALERFLAHMRFCQPCAESWESCEVGQAAAALLEKPA